MKIGSLVCKSDGMKCDNYCASSLLRRGGECKDTRCCTLFRPYPRLFRYGHDTSFRWRNFREVWFALLPVPGRRGTYTATERIKRLIARYHHTAGCVRRHFINKISMNTDFFRLTLCWLSFFFARRSAVISVATAPFSSLILLSVSVLSRIWKIGEIVQN